MSSETGGRTAARLDALMTAIADGVAWSVRSPIQHTPAEYGLAYEDVTFASEDGTTLTAWFVPAAGADTVVIVNHPRWFSRSGFPSHREPWRSMHAETGNDIEVDFVPDIALLHEAGYHVLAYDLRNFGRSATADGGVSSGGNLEARDVLGSLAYARSRPDLREAKIALFSRCLGANATMFAMERAPEAFTGVRCLIACQPLSPRMPLERGLERQSVPSECAEEIDRRIRQRTGFGLDAMSPVRAAGSVRIPVLLYGVHDDVMTRPSDLDAMFATIPGDTPKERFWIHGTTRRWDGYLHFQRHPDRILDRLARWTR